MAVPKEPTKPVKPVTPAPAAATDNSTHKTALIVTAIIVAVFIFVIPAIFLMAGGIFVSKKIADGDLKVNTSDNSVTVKDKEGNEFSAGESQTLPKDFPSEVEVYSGEIVSSGRSVVEGKTAWTVAVRTSDNATQVGESLTSQFSGNGWNSNMNNTSNSGGLISATNGTIRVSAFYSSEDGKTAIVYTVTPENE